MEILFCGCDVLGCILSIWWQIPVGNISNVFRVQIQQRAGAYSGYKGVGGGMVGGHLTLQILTLLRYVVDIGLNNPNPIFF